MPSDLIQVPGAALRVSYSLAAHEAMPRRPAMQSKRELGT
jgi:hypothetical protein